MQNNKCKKGFVFGILLLFVTASNISALNTYSTTTTERGNNPPYTPSKPNPPDQAKDVDINTDLSWTGGDPDFGDTVTYDVFFGSMVPLQKVASNISAPSYNPGVLSNGLTYYWRIVAWDNYGLSNNGPGWRFTTIYINNNPPNKPSKPVGKENGNINAEYTYKSITFDPDGDQVYYLWDWGDGNNSGWIGPNNYGVTCEAKYTWNVKGTYNIKVKAKDIYSLESIWSDPLLITMPYSYMSIPRSSELFDPPLLISFNQSDLNISNVGIVTALDITRNISSGGGLLLIDNRHINGTLNQLDACESMTTKLRFMLGFGKITFHIQAGAIDVEPLDKHKTGTLALFIIL